VVQEIKFDPCVMCEHLDKRTSFRLSQVDRMSGYIYCKMAFGVVIYLLLLFF